MDILQYIFSTFFQRNICNLTAEAAPHLVQFLFDFKSRKSLVIRSGLPSLNRCFLLMSVKTTVSSQLAYQQLWASTKI